MECLHRHPPPPMCCRERLGCHSLCTPNADQVAQPDGGPQLKEEEEEEEIIRVKVELLPGSPCSGEFGICHV